MQFFDAFPEAAEVSVVRPLVLCGMPRTGSSLLQRLLSYDPAARSLPLWVLEGDPMDPRGTVESAGRDSEAWLRVMKFIGPNIYERLMEFHRMAANLTEEDIVCTL